MGRIAIDQIKEGMVLAGDVVDVNSRLLFSKGGTIEAKHIRMFKMWGIGEVHVQGDFEFEADHYSAEDPEHIDRAAQYTQALFRFNDLDHPVTKQLLAICTLHHGQNLQLPAGDPDTPMQEERSPVQPVTNVRATLKKTQIKLPEIPSIVYELNEVIADPFGSADDIAQVVSKSPSLASLLLRIVNSAFYGFPSRIDSISRAVALIGSKEISSLGLGISTMRLFKEIPHNLIDVGAFFKHSLACGILSRILAAHLNFNKTEQLFVAGLLHDIGRVILFKYFPEQCHSMMIDARSSGRLLFEMEHDYLRCRHTQIGRDLFKKWKLPYSLENCTNFHHTPSKAQEPQQATVVHLADICAHGLELGVSGESYVPVLDKAACDALHLTPGTLKSAIQQALHQLEYLETVFQEHVQDGGTSKN